MYKVKVLKHFSAAHYLREYQGGCENLHGHNWQVEVELLSRELDNKGMVIDFKELKSVLSGVLDKLDHKCLNDIEYFKTHNTTSENIARYIQQELSAGLKKKKEVKLNVYVWETDSSQAAYIEE